MKLRLSTEHDIDELVGIARELWTASPVYAPYPFSDTRIRNWLYAAVDCPADTFCMVGEAEDGRIAGVILACAFPMLCSDAYAVSELGLFVRPEWRGSRLSLSLLREMEKWARNRGASRICAGSSAAISDEAATRVYTHMGFDTYPSFYKTLGLMN